MLARLSPFSVAIYAISLLAGFYIALPIVVIVVAPLGETGFLRFPPEGLTLRWYQAALADQRYMGSLLTSLKVAGLTTVFSTVMGVLAALGLSRGNFRGRAFLEQFFLSPLIMPSLVLAVALSLYFSRGGWQVGTMRLVLAHCLVCTPFVIRVTLPLFRQYDRALEEAALSLGASRLGAFFLVFLPVMRIGVLSGAAIAFIMSLDELVLTLFLGDPGAPTLPIMMYSSVLMGFDPVVAAVSGLLVLATVLVILVVQVLASAGRRL